MYFHHFQAKSLIVFGCSAVVCCSMFFELSLTTFSAAVNGSVGTNMQSSAELTFGVDPDQPNQSLRLPTNVFSVYLHLTREHLTTA